MLENTTKYLPQCVHAGYADAVDASLQRGVLSYERELILTHDYLLGTVKSDTQFFPVAIPRARVTEYVFYYRCLVRGRYSRTYGVLSCRANGQSLADRVLGQVPKTRKILGILDHYQIPWTEGELIYHS